MITEISCPACQNGIIQIDPKMLAFGASFPCNVCDAKVALADGSKDVFRSKLKAYEQYQNQVQDIQAAGNNPEVSHGV